MCQSMVDFKQGFYYCRFKSPPRNKPVDFFLQKVIYKVHLFQCIFALKKVHMKLPKYPRIENNYDLIYMGLTLLSNRLYKLHDG